MPRKWSSLLMNEFFFPWHEKIAYKFIYITKLKEDANKASKIPPTIRAYSISTKDKVLNHNERSPSHYQKFKILIRSLLITKKHQHSPQLQITVYETY